MDYEEMANNYGIKWPHDERCQGDRRCREHFIERLKAAEAEVAGGALFFTVMKNRPDGPPASDLEVSKCISDDPPTFVVLFRQQTRDRKLWPQKEEGA